MADIQVLSSELADKIAAGEVAERPSAVVKELVENSIDAGADSIEVEIKSGGVEYIRVTDNGCGIPPEQAELAFMRHATSKLRTVDDLYRLGTMGFRGEALASICAVAEVELITKIRDCEEGRFLRLERGKVQENSPIGCADGTVMVVQRLFENIPARMKFLKKNSTEAGYVADILTRIALSRPDIAFNYISDGKEIFSTTGDGKTENAVLKLYGVDHAKALIPVKYREGSVSISGVIGKPQLARGNRSRQTLFVNGRYIKSPAASKLVAEGYRNSVMKGKFPFFVLNITVPSELVDVNVHPAKTEVKFADEKQVYHVLYHAVASSIATPERAFEDDNTARASFESSGAAYNNKINNNNKITSADQKLAAEYLANILTADKLNETSKTEDMLSRRIFADNVTENTDNAENILIGESSACKNEDFAEQHASYKQKVAVLQEKKTNREYASVGDNVVLSEMKRERPSYVGAWDFKESKFEDKLKNDENDNSEKKDEISSIAVSEKYSQSDKPSLNKAADNDSSGNLSNSVNDIFEAKKAAPVQESMEDCIGKSELGEINEAESVKKPRIIGQIFDTYVLCQTGEDFWMIDQHAAHERLRFERLKTDYYSQNRMSQLLLTPMIIKLDYNETQTVLLNSEEYAKFGFDIEDFGSGSIIVNATPIMADERQITDLILEIADALENRGRYSVADFEERLLDMIACKYAVKANHRLNADELKEVADIVIGLEEKGVTTCPHGRPIKIKLSKTDIEKMFKRRV